MGGWGGGHTQSCSGKRESGTLGYFPEGKSTGSPKVEPGTNILSSDPDDSQICVKAEAIKKKNNLRGPAGDGRQGI